MVKTNLLSGASKVSMVKTYLLSGASMESTVRFTFDLLPGKP